MGKKKIEQNTKLGLRDKLVKNSENALVASWFQLIVVIFLIFSVKFMWAIALITIFAFYLIFITYFERNFIDWAKRQKKTPTPKVIKEGYWLKAGAVICSTLFFLVAAIVITMALNDNNVPAGSCSFPSKCWSSGLSSLTRIFLVVFLGGPLLIAISLGNDYNSLSNLSDLKNNKQNKRSKNIK